MALEAGTRLGPYSVIGPIGAGGMGEVYRARDTKLGRDVALKVLPASFVGDAERMARFHLEAQMLASLNHPHIAALYGMQESGDVQALVMELVEGPTLAERIALGPIPLEEALPVARQIAEALEAAHDKGIVHRDLKPANVKITPEGVVKVLDFGLAKATAHIAAPTDPALSNTLTMTATQAGVIIGSPGYMSPEHARGQVTDKRTDVWAFGVVLFEMLAGTQAFAGDTISDTLASVLKADPDWAALPPQTPAGIRRLLKHCLERDRRRRLRDIGDAVLEIEDTRLGEQPAPQPPRPEWTRWAGWVVAAVLLVCLAAVVWRWRQPAPAQVTRRFAVPAEAIGLSGDLAISPDGAHIVHGGPNHLYLRNIGDYQFHPIPGTEGGRSPFFSPDGKWIGFFAAGRMKKVAVAGGSPLPLCEAREFLGASWGEDGTILYAEQGQGVVTGGELKVTSDEGTAPRTLAKPDRGRNETSLMLPQILPGGQAALVTVLGGSAPRVDAVDLRTGRRIALVANGVGGQFASGFLVFGRENTLLAARFDPARLRITGEPAAFLSEVGQVARGSQVLAISQEGTLVYRHGLTGDRRTLVRVAADGAAQPLGATEKQPYFVPRWSPDGKRLAVSEGVIATGNADIWIYEPARDATRRLTFGPRLNGSPIWTPDGKRVAYYSDRDGTQNIYWKTADSSGPEQRLTTSANQQTTGSFSPDGKLLAYTEARGKTGLDVMILPVGGGAPRAFLETPANERLPRFSPDGRWIAYVSDETGRNEVYVVPFPGPAGKWQVSTEGGDEPVWARNGKQLFYRSDDRLMAVDVAGETALRLGKPHMLFEARYFRIDPLATYDVAPDGSFVFLRTDEQGASQLNVVLNWFEELRRR